MRIVADNAVSFQGPRGDGVARTAPREALLRRMKLVAKARFEANTRLGAKASATNLGLQIANLYTIAIGIFLIQFPASGVVKLHGGVLNYVSLIASVFVQMMALIETFKDYGGRARLMHDCAMRVNSLAQQLDLDPREDGATLEAYRRAYEHAIQDAATNHDPIDYRAAILDPSRWRDRTHADRWAIVAWQVRYLWNVYGLTAVILTLPILVGGILMTLQLG